jgi:hypothetical protein
MKAPCVQIRLQVGKVQHKIVISLFVNVTRISHYFLLVTCYSLLVSNDHFFESTSNDITSNYFVLYIYCQSNVLQCC